MAKTILKTSEKSNFILNMTEEQYSKIASFGLLSACFAVSLFTIIPEAAEGVSYSVSAAGLAVSGVFCLILALIALVKKYVSKSVLLPVIAFAAMLGWGTVSLIDSYDMNVGFYGFPQRGEGLMALIFYFGIFVTAISIKREKAMKTLISGIIGVGLLNSAVALIQIFFHKLSHYTMISLYFDFAASGLSQSPIFLAMVLTLSLIASNVTGVLDENKNRRIFCIISSCIFSFVILHTFSVMGICGIALSLVSAAAAVFIKKKTSPLRLVPLIAPAAAGALAVVLCMTGVTSILNKYPIADGYTLWTGDSFKRISASGNYNPKTVDIQKIDEVYSYINRKTVNIIKEYPLTGTGPEQLVYPQVHTTRLPSGDEFANMQEMLAINAGTFDKTYNEYLYTAATRGIPSLIALLAVIIPVVWIGFKKLKKDGSAENICLFFITLGGVLVFLIGCSNITFSPIFWASAGLLCADVKKDIPKKYQK